MPITFPFPVNILAFNRPQYLEKVLSSLREQTISLDNSLTTIWIDGFQGSRDEHRWQRNRTHIVSKLAKEYFPDARFVIRDRNHGIAMQYRDAEAYSFSLDTDVAFFFEEDLVLSPHYLEALMDLETKTRAYPQIGRIAAHGYVRNRSECVRNSGIGVTGTTWGFGLRRRQYELLLPLLSGYYELLEGEAYWKRSHELVHAYMESYDVQIRATSQDWIKSSLAQKLGIIGISTYSRLGKYIGRRGEHKSYISSFTRSRDIFKHKLDAAWTVSEKDIEDFLYEHSL